MNLSKLLLIISIFASLSVSADNHGHNSITEDISWKGSLRFRYERTDKRGSDLRNRQRVQAKLSAKKKLNKVFKGEIGLVSGSSDPVSSNQSFDGAFTSKGINLDVAVIKANYKGQKINFGKMKNPIYAPGGSEIIWDGDLRPEGVHGNFGYKFSNTSIGLNLGQFWVEENSSAEEIYLSTGQLVLSQKLKPVTITLGAGVFSYDNLAGKTTLVDATDSFGNSATANKYDYNYKMTEIFGEVKFKVAKIPFTVYYTTVSNSKAQRDDTATSFGLKAGKAKKQGSWKAQYLYKKVEKDAVLGAFTDSDFKGAGTDGKGHEVQVGYAIMDNTVVNVTHFINETSLTTANSRDYDKTQLDLKISF
tara:strand:- start:70771 stop:71856 length:1086 start_codon:yes stop_codon:yes gene_type:complete